MYQDYFTTMMDKHDVIGEINAEVLLVLMTRSSRRGPQRAESSCRHS